MIGAKQMAAICSASPYGFFSGVSASWLNALSYVAIGALTPSAFISAICACWNFC